MVEYEKSKVKKENEVVFWTTYWKYDCHYVLED